MKNKFLKISSLIFVISLATFTVISVYAAYSLFGDTSGDKKQIVVPNFVGQAVDELYAEDCEIEKSYIFDENAPRGIILSQSPSAGRIRKVAKGEKITVGVNVSLGRESVVMPRLIGHDSREALIEARLISANMGIATLIVDEYGTGEEPDRVTRTEPRPGEDLTGADKIILYVARANTRDTVEVPNVVGLDLEDAELLLNAVGLRATASGRGVVLAQSVPPRSLVLEGEEIVLECEENKDENKTDEPRGGGIPREWWRIFG